MVAFSLGEGWGPLAMFLFCFVLFFCLLPSFRLLSLSLSLALALLDLSLRFFLYLILLLFSFFL